MDVFTPEDLKFWDDNGYIVLKQAVPPENVTAVVDAVYDFLGIPREPDTSWYAPPVNISGNVEMYQHQALWSNRQHERVYHAFRQLHGREELWVSLDRCSFKPPPHRDYPNWQKAGFLHLDAKTDSLPIHFGTQGVLSLTETRADQGGFHCLPGWHKRTEEWIDIVGPNGAIHGKELYDTDLPITPIETHAGDLVIWNLALPHGNGWNTSTLPRMAQYIMMYPAGSGKRRLDERIAAWESHCGPPESGKPQPFPGDPREWEKTHCERAELTELGRRLLGVEPWPETVSA